MAKGIPKLNGTVPLSRMLKNAPAYRTGDGMYARIRGCAMKRDHLTMADAEREAERLNKSGKAYGKERAYKCQFCRMYHVGREADVRANQGA